MFFYPIKHQCNSVSDNSSKFPKGTTPTNISHQNKYTLLKYLKANCVEIKHLNLAVTQMPFSKPVAKCGL